MPNKNYLSGRRLEYEMITIARAQGGKATRTAGSHGWIDVIRQFDTTVDGCKAWGLLYPGFTYLGCEADGPCYLERVGKKYTDQLSVWIARDGHRVGNVVDHKRLVDHNCLFRVYHLIQCKRKRNKGVKS